MRNANQADVDLAKSTGKLEENVMYDVNGLRVHGKKVSYMISKYMLQDGEAIVEDAAGCLYNVLINAHIKPIPKGPSQQPRKPRRKPVKGTKPEQLLPMSADVKLEVGDKVVLANGSRTVIRQVDNTCAPYQTSDYVWHLYNGECVNAHLGSMYAQHNITHKIIPWQQQSRVHIDGKLAEAATDLKIAPQKSPEQEAFEKGYWISNNGSTPKFLKDQRVEVLFSHGEKNNEQTAEDWAWGGDADESYYIVAYRKAKQ